MKKLYVVDVTHSVYVMADDEHDAEVEAQRGIREYGDQPEVRAHEFKGGPIQKEWANALPFGEDCHTVAQIAAAILKKAK